jgi:S1-C subfamily serine protease
MRSRRARGVALVALAALLCSGVGYAAVSAVSSGGGPSAPGNGPIAARSSAHGWLGVDRTSFSPVSGVVIVDVVPGSPADQAGLQPGDVIKQVGNQPVQSPADLESALAGLPPGEKIEIQFERGPMLYATQATLRARPANGP